MKVKVRLALDLLDYVGMTYYKSSSHFIREAKRLGCSRRVPNVPEDIKEGKSRVFLVNKEGVFAYFVIHGIIYVCKKGLDIPKELADRGVEPITVQEAASVPERGCGNLQVGAIYLLSEEDLEKVTDLASASELEGRITLIDPPVPYHGGAFRGHKYVRGDYILERRPEHTWFITERFRRTAKSLIAEKIKEDQQ